MSHYQFETLHPFPDRNGRIRRLLIVLCLVTNGVPSEPALTVSPWFEARRRHYYDRLLAVSAEGDWDSFVRFFAEGLGQPAARTRNERLALVKAQGELKDLIRASAMRADSARTLVDIAAANPSFTIRKAETGLGTSYV